MTKRLPIGVQSFEKLREGDFAYVDKTGYNPFSLLNAFADNEFHSYWYQTGTPNGKYNNRKHAKK